MAFNRSKQKKLSDAPKAVATTLGWVDAEKGELLVSIRGLPNAAVWDRKTNTFTKNGKKFEPLKKDNTSKFQKTETVATPAPAPVETQTIDASPAEVVTAETLAADQAKLERETPKEVADKQPKQKKASTKKATKKKVSE